jgi:glycosyltransferase involved in cell wall biosynthesis
MFIRDGCVCEDCMGKFVPWPGVAHACYRGSRAQSGVTAAMLTFHRARRTWHKDVDLFIALTEFSRRKFIEGGLPAEKIVVKPNFLFDDPGTGPGGDSFLYVGRLDAPKGVKTLVSAWSRCLEIRLSICGSGVLESQVRELSGANQLVNYIGQAPKEVVIREMQRARALVVPSEWDEGFPMTIVEAFACGLPVIASRLGAMEELIEDGRTGLHFTPGDPDDLAAKVRWAQDHPEEMRVMGMNARREFEQKYTAERNYQLLMACYEQALENRRADRSTRLK